MHSIRVSKKPKLSHGFSSAAAVLADPAAIVSPTVNDDGHTPVTELSFDGAVHSTDDALDDKHTTDALLQHHVTIPVSLVGWPHYAHLHKHIKPPIGTLVDLQREPDNNHDECAIQVSISNSTKLGYILATEAAILAPLLDTEQLTFESVSVSKLYPASFQLIAKGTVASETVYNSLASFSKMAYFDTQAAIRDIEQAKEAPYQLSGLQELAWTPPQTDKVPKTKEPLLLALAHPYDATKVRALLSDETEQVSWPPSNDILQSFGFAPSSDTAWWFDTAGLLPPVDWNVAGALDVTPKLPGISATHKQRAADMLHHAIHGVANAWHPDTLRAAETLLHEPNFWCQRSGDALIRAFGGPYVLGQQAGKLVLVRGAPHSDLTAKLCQAHNIVYTLIHLQPPSAPGFNTLIFGCNMRGAGFHYHQDAVSELKAKNASLLPRQPVVTTILYEKEADSGKEVVLWKPVLNWSSGTTDMYCAARAIQTFHGMMHVQQSGLQRQAQHGVFHTPGDDEQRRGFRVAVTARISKPDAAVIVDAFAKQECYCKEIGPDGDVAIAKVKR